MTEPGKPEAAKTLIDLLLNDPAFKAAVGKRTSLFLLATLGIGVAELTYGLPVITLATAPLAGGIIAVLLTEVEDWLRSGKPEVIFYLCPAEQTFTAIRWVDLPRHRKLKGCASCGAALMRRCRMGKHFIVSPDPTNPATPPPITGFCPRCDPSLPKAQRSYV